MEMNNEENCISESYNEVIDILRNFIWQLMHHRALKKVIVEFERDFWMLAANNSYDLSIIEWCKIFGSYSENTHWTKKFLDKTEFRKFIFESVDMSKEQWDSYAHGLRDYRNRWIGHFNSNFRPSQHPDLEPAFRSILACYDYLLKKMAKYSIEHNLPDSLSEYSKALFEQAVEFTGCAYNSAKHIKYKYSSDNITIGSTRCRKT
jgi:hypothetical protein